MAKESKAPEVKGRPTAEMIAKWKEQYGDVNGIYIPFKGAPDEKLIMFRKVTMIDIERALIQQKKNVNRANEFGRNIIANCKIYEDAGMLEDDAAMLAVLQKVDDLYEIKEAEVVKF